VDDGDGDGDDDRDGDGDVSVNFVDEEMNVDNGRHVSVKADLSARTRSGVCWGLVGV